MVAHPSLEANYNNSQGVGQMELSQIAQQVVTNKADIDNLKRWQEAQNGSILRAEKKIDKLDEKLDEKIGELKNGFNRILGGIAIACVLLAIDIIMRFAG